MPSVGLPRFPFSIIDKYAVDIFKALESLAKLIFFFLS